MEPLSCWQQHRRCVRERWGTTLTFKKQTQHINCTYHFAFPTASPAIPRQSMCAGEVWMAGAAVRLTATAVPSHGTCGFEQKMVWRRRVMAWAWWLLGWWGCSGRWAERWKQHEDESRNRPLSRIMRWISWLFLTLKAPKMALCGSYLRLCCVW
jgi:hypothetical protein